MNVLPIRVDDEDKARWQAAADDAGYLLSEWIRTVCNSAATGAEGRIAKRRRRPEKSTEASSSARAGLGSVEILTPLARAGGKKFKGPDPKPAGRKKK